MNENFIQGFEIHWKEIEGDSYVRNIKALRKLKEMQFNKPITFFVGENGSGKSTILEAIAENYGFNKEGGSKNYMFSTYEEASDLKNALYIQRGNIKKAQYNYFFRAETFFNVSTFMEKGLGELSYHGESHGEGFLHMFEGLCNSKGIYLMDEPEAALSPKRQLQLFSMIYEAAKNGSQFIIVSHSPILLGIPNADIFSFSENGVHKCKYEDTESYQITSLFINHKETMIKELTKE